MRDLCAIYARICVNIANSFASHVVKLIIYELIRANEVVFGVNNRTTRTATDTLLAGMIANGSNCIRPTRHNAQKRTKHAMKYTGYNHLQVALLIIVFCTLQHRLYKT